MCGGNLQIKMLFYSETSTDLHLIRIYNEKADMVLIYDSLEAIVSLGDHMIVQFPENLPQGEMYMNFLDGTFTVGSSESKITKSTEQGTITVNIDSVFTPAYTKLEISPKESAFGESQYTDRFDFLVE